MDVYERIRKCGIVPVVAVDKADQAVDLAKALLAGGIDVIEITFRTSAARDAIKLVADQVPEMLVGAGTVLNQDQLTAAQEAGAQFIVSPGMDTELIDQCHQAGIVIFPGAVTPGEIQAGLKHGISVFKFFPAANYGGAKTIKSLSAPFNQISFMPTGGVNKDNLAEYLALPCIVACGGSWMVKSDLVKAGKFEEITRLTKEAVAILREVRG